MRRDPVDPLRLPTEIYPHVNAGETFRVEPNWPAANSAVTVGGITGVAIAPDGHIWVVSHGSPPVREYDAAGQFLRGWGDGQIVQGHQIRFDREGHVWIADCGRHCIHK